MATGKIQKLVSDIFDVDIGSIISVDGVLLPVKGRIWESYHFNNQRTVSYTLALGGRQEVGAENEAGEWHMWYSRFSRTFPMSSYERVVKSLGPDVEVGKLQRHYSEGEVEWDYPDYVFGKRMGKGVFLSRNTDGKTFDVWINYRPREVKDAGYQLKPYGWIKSVEPGKEELVIAPGKSTALNANPLNAQGLCGHPGEEWEYIEHLGNLDGTRGNTSLVYRVLEGTDIVDKVYGQGSEFFSVSPSGEDEGKSGYWHELINRSNSPIRLLISWKD